MPAINTVTTVLAQADYSGTVHSSALAVTGATGAISAAGLLGSTDLANPANAITNFAVEVSFDGGLTFEQGSATAWAGNTLDQTNNPSPPALDNLQYQPMIPTHARVRLDLPQTLNIGATLSFT